jgi:hypothetical protein
MASYPSSVGQLRASFFATLTLDGPTTQLNQIGGPDAGRGLVWACCGQVTASPAPAGSTLSSVSSESIRQQ